MESFKKRLDFLNDFVLLCVCNNRLHLRQPGRLKERLPKANNRCGGGGGKKKKKNSHFLKETLPLSATNHRQPHFAALFCSHHGGANNKGEEK